MTPDPLLQPLREAVALAFGKWPGGAEAGSPQRGNGGCRVEERAARAEQSGDAAGTALDDQEATAASEHAVRLAQGGHARRIADRGNRTVARVDDDDVERVSAEGQRWQRYRLHVDEHACGLAGASCVGGLAFIRHRKCRMTAQSDLRGDRASERSIIDADLQRALAHAYAAHRHRQPLEARLA